jgi:putative nucleotidyltransferase with HDIG domain
MQLKKFPDEINELLQGLAAPPRLIAHLTLVHDVAFTIIHQIKCTWSNLIFDQEAVLFGAATHDIGKVMYPAELTQSGKNHEEGGASLLTQNGFSKKLARFTRTHATWESEDVTIEDLLVAWADKIWKGKREVKLELKLAEFIINQTKTELWLAYSQLDEIADEITKLVDERINWQSSFSLHSDFPVIDIGGWSDDLSPRREELY